VSHKIAPAASHHSCAADWDNPRSAADRELSQLAARGQTSAPWNHAARFASPSA